MIDDGGNQFDLDTFEAGPGSPDDWAAQNGVDPSITNQTSYCGARSLWFGPDVGAGGAMGRNFDNTAATFEPGQLLKFGSQDYPFVCAAMRIPKGTKASFLVRSVELGYRSILITETPTGIICFVAVVVLGILCRLFFIARVWFFHCDLTFSNLLFSDSNCQGVSASDLFSLVHSSPFSIHVLPVLLTLITLLGALQYQSMGRWPGAVDDGQWRHSCFNLTAGFLTFGTSVAVVLFVCLLL